MKTHFPLTPEMNALSSNVISANTHSTHRTYDTNVQATATTPATPTLNRVSLICANIPPAALIVTCAGVDEPVTVPLPIAPGDTGLALGATPVGAAELTATLLDATPLGTASPGERLT